MTKVKSIFMLGLFLFLACSAPQTKTKAPNVIYILADDLGFGDLSIYNNTSKIKTPHLDRLAREGMRFTDMHTTSSVCTPTRYSVLTGEYAWRTALKKGVLWSYGPLMIPDEKETVAKLFQRNHYQTAVIGKWHLGLDWQLKIPHRENQVIKNEWGLVTDYKEEIINFSKNPTKGPKNVGFDYSFIIPASLDIPPYVYLENEKITAKVNAQTEGSNMDGDRDYDFWRPGPVAEDFEFYQVLPTFITKAKAYIDGVKDSKQPFFLYLPLPAPHTPWVPTADYKGQSDAGMYGEFVQMVDAQIGQLLMHLEAQGISEETMIVFTSDNGPYWKPHHIEKYNHKAAAHLRGMKGDIYDAGHRVPFIVKWPGKVKAGSVEQQPHSLADFYATAAELLGTTAKTTDSYSILDVLLEQHSKEVVSPVVHHSSRGHFALRVGDWKMIEKRGSGGFSPPATASTPPGQTEERLYLMSEDPSETTDLSWQYPEILNLMKRQLDSIRQLH
jgi:arylsulfatase A